MKKHISYIILAGAILLSLSFSVSAQSLPTITMDKPIQDMTISELQAKIAEILSVIQQLQALIAQLQPGGGGVSCNFYRNLYPGTSGSDVKCLQQYLNNTGHTVASSGPGSPNSETIYYGSLTRAAVKKWQDANHIESGAWWGYFGPKSQAIYNELVATTGEQEEPSTPPSSGTYCGDSIAQRPSDQMIIEDCDGTDLRNKTCLTQGYTGGTLSCSNDCSFNTSLCTGTGPGGGEPPTPPGSSTSCGDSVVQTPNSEGIYEVCDSTNLGTSTCLTYGYIGGTLSCSSNCITFNTTGCITESGGGGGGGGGGDPDPEPDPGPVCGDTDGICPSGCTYSQDTDCTYCGDSIIQSPNDEGISEVCDTASLTGETCITKGFPGGTLQCSSTCLTFDTSSCTLPEPPNEAPVLNPIGNKTISENQQLSFTVSATDPDGDDLSYSISDIPTGAIFNASTRTFTWTPTYEQQGTYTPTFTVSDGSLTDTETITITVSNVNRAPVLSPIGNKSIDENQTLTFTISATDPDNDTLYYSILDTPSGASFDSSIRTFTWTPTYTQAGTYDVTFIVSDTEYADQETITITVNDVETGPVCGDSICEGTETCSTCSADCGECAPDFPTDYVAYWKFDSETGGITPDETGVNNGTLMDDAAIISDPERGNVLSLDGTGDYVDAGNDVSLDLTGDFTIALWFYANEWVGEALGIISKRDGYVSMDWELFYTTQASGTCDAGEMCFWYGNSGAVQLFEGLDVSPSADTWNHVTITRSGSTFTLYLNGVSQGTESSATAMPTGDSLKFGVLGGDATSELNGLIDEVMIYDKALNEAEILQIMSIGNECTDISDCSSRECMSLLACDPEGTGYDYLDPMGCGYDYSGSGTVCDDSLYCTTAGTSTCDGAGSCTGGTALDCSDAFTCTDDSCSEVLDTCENTANDNNCIAGETCDPLDPSADPITGCVADPCAGIDDCGDYIGETECNADTCVPGGCLWNSGLDVCEEVAGPSTDYEGFGAVTRGALDCPTGYTIYNVTSLADDGSAGTFRNAVSQGCRYIVFDVGGTINMAANLNIRRSYITIDGSSAPSPGITIIQYATTIEAYASTGPAHDIIIHHLRMDGQATDHSSGRDIWGLDGESAPVYNIIIDHVTAIAARDGIFDTIGDVSNVTLSWNLMMDTWYATLIKYGRKERLSLHHNVFARNNERQPYVANDVQLLDFVNNVIYGWGWMEGGAHGLRIHYSAVEINPSLNVENNVFHYVSQQLAPWGWPNQAIIFERGDPDEGDVYFNGNIVPVGETDYLDPPLYPRLPIPAYAEVTMYDASTLGDTVVPFAGTHYPTQEEQDLLNEISIALGASPARISQTDDTIDEKINNLASVLSGIRLAVQDIIKKMQSIFNF